MYGQKNSCTSWKSQQTYAAASSIVDGEGHNPQNTAIHWEYCHKEILDLEFHKLNLWKAEANSVAEG